MKIAIPTKDGQVDSHFGHCEYYTIVTVDEKSTIQTNERFDAPIGCGCKSDIAITLAQMGVSILLAGNMGLGAVNKISAAGIKVVRGCTGDVLKVSEAFLKNEVADSGYTCAAHSGEGESHVCNH